MRMETHVLDILQWQCMYPTAWRFLGILNAHLHLPPAVKGMADLLIVCEGGVYLRVVCGVGWVCVGGCMGGWRTCD